MITFWQAVWKCALPDAPTKIVLLKLADYANTEGLAWPSLATLARETELSVATVKRRIAWLDQSGFIVRRSSRDRVTSNRYTLSLEKIQQSAREGRLSVSQGLAQPEPRVGSDGAMGRLSVSHEPSLNRQRTPNEPHEKQTTPEGVRTVCYPFSEAEARSTAETAGVSADYAAILWHECEGVGGKDFNGNPVTNFASFAKSCWTRKQQHDRRRQPSAPREPKPLTTWEKQTAEEKRRPDQQTIVMRKL